MKGGEWCPQTWKILLRKLFKGKEEGRGGEGEGEGRGGEIQLSQWTSTDTSQLCATWNGLEHQRQDTCNTC